MRAACTVMQTEASSLMLLDEQTGELNVSIPTGPVQENIEGISIPKNKGIGGWVLRHNKPYFCNDISKSELFWKDLTDDFTSQNIICVPLCVSSGKPFGVIQAVNRKSGGDFIEKDVIVFEALAMHISIAIDRARNYEEMLKRLEDREIQLSEIHHRLKNNLATISGLIQLDLADLSEENCRDLLKVTGSRIRSVSDVHSLLYDQKDLGELELGNYIQRVAQNIKHIFSEPVKEISITTDLDEIQIEANRAMTAGLIINELLINGYKHAFEGMEKGEIGLQLRDIGDNTVKITVSDNGIGMKSILHDNEDNTHGTYIVKALTNKINGELNIRENKNSGTSLELIFKSKKTD